MEKRRERIISSSRRIVSSLEPKLLWDLFFQLSCIPRDSKKEKAASIWVHDLCKSLHLEVKVDDMYNVLVTIPASDSKFSQVGAIVIQSHLDMICDQNHSKDGVSHNFDTDPIEFVLSEDKKFIHANGTTLGADDGIGVAQALSIAHEHKEFEHGPIKLLFTVQEEIGCQGAKGMDKEWIEDAKYLLNLDTTPFGAIIIGCAGGQSIFLTKEIHLKRIEKKEYNFRTLEFSFSGLLGGHSGKNIHMKRGNSVKLMGRVLKKLKEDFHDSSKLELFLMDFDAGDKMNAIPRESRCKLLLVEKNDIFCSNISFRIDCAILTIIKEYQKNVKGKIKFKAEEIEDFPKDHHFECFENQDFDKFLELILEVENGVIKFCEGEDENSEVAMVKTSSNLANVKLRKGDGLKRKIEFGLYPRSLVEEEHVIILERFVEIAIKYEYDINTSKLSMPWEPKRESELVSTAESVFFDLFQEKPVVKSIHAGLESAVFVQKNKNLQLIAFGPNLYDQHSPDERVEIESTVNTYRITKEIVKRICKI